MRHGRRSVRVRLTALYGALFLVSGAAMLAITYGLVNHATSGRTAVVTLPDGSTAAVNAEDDGRAKTRPPDVRLAGRGIPPGGAPTPDQVRELAAAQHAAQMHELLVQSGIALSIMAALSILLGWIVAGRVLRPLRTITTTARDISATNLDRRLGLGGPDDELRELGDTFDALLDRLEAAFQSQRLFVANASHELRTPLARQRAIIQVALGDPDATLDSLRRAHERVLATGVEQERLIDALLTLARGRAGLDHSDPFDLAIVTEHVVGLHRADAASAGVDIDLALDPAPTAGDRPLAERLVTNVVDNAIRYNVRDGRVEIATHVDDGRSLLVVENTGPHIRSGDVDRLLEPFQRIGSERTHADKGLGLGLSIVRAIAEAHGGRIDTAPRPDGGLRVLVSLPARAVAGKPRATSSRAGLRGGRLPADAGRPS